MAVNRLLDPVSWRGLPWHKKMHQATMLYFRKCSEESIFSKKGLSPSYFKVRKFFEKKEIREMNLLYDYLWSIEGKKVMSVVEVLEAMRRYNLSQRFIRVVPPNPVKQEEITLSDVIDL